MRRLPGVLVVVAACLLTACSSDGGGGGQTIDVVSTDTECRVSHPMVKAGKTTFILENKGSKFTEAYVYAAGDRVVTERENVGPGTKAKFSVTLAPGTYEVACKPGQAGNGIRRRLVVTGVLKKGAAAPKAPDRALSMTSKDYSYDGLGGFTAKAGDTVAFSMHNEGEKEHEFEVLGANGKALGEIGPTKPGATGTVTLTFKKAGTYTYVCGIEDHEKRGMKGTFTVS
jgi:uncharacterized cupredoxin-like copper-binding protein